LASIIVLKIKHIIFETLYFRNWKGSKLMYCLLYYQDSKPL